VTVESPFSASGEASGFFARVGALAVFAACPVFAAEAFFVA
jgi:hypothetical protein